MAVISSALLGGCVCIRFKNLQIGQLIRHRNRWYRVVNAVCGVLYQLEPYKPWAHR